MRQLSLFDRLPQWPAKPEPDASTEQLLRSYGECRLANGASSQTVRRECCQLRVIVRGCSPSPNQRSIVDVLTDLPAVAKALREPPAVISAATGRTRLIAVQRFLRFIGPSIGREPNVDIAALDQLLPAKSAPGWHTAGTLVAGRGARQRRRGPTLASEDLDRIVLAAGEGKPIFRAARDRALVAIQCFSGLRAEEVLALQWEDILPHVRDDRYFGLEATVWRRGTDLPLPLPGSAGQALMELRAQFDTLGIDTSGPVFRVREGSDRLLAYRTARKVLVAACATARLPAATSAELRAACAWRLKRLGLSDHEVCSVLGLSRVRTVDQLLRGHTALDAQRQVRENREQGRNRDSHAAGHMNS